MRYRDQHRRAALIGCTLTVLLGFVPACERVASDDTSAGGTASGFPAGAVKSSAAAARSAPLPGCKDAVSTCMRDTAYGHTIDYSPGWLVDADWIVFGDAGDTIEASAYSEEKTPRVLSVSVAMWGRRDLKAPRVDMTTAGAVMVMVLADLYGFAGDTIPYVIHLRRQGRRSPSLQPTGALSRLTIQSGREADRFSVMPVAVGVVPDRQSWSVSAGTYRVALVPDSLYEICRLPCQRPDTLTLRPGATVTRRF
jgi:hypothetical protein